MAAIWFKEPRTLLPGETNTSSACKSSSPAGTFRTFHVICNNQRSKLLNFELWYAPEVGHMVKERTRFSYGIRERELTGFKFAERPR